MVNLSCCVDVVSCRPGGKIEGKAAPYIQNCPSSLRNHRKIKKVERRVEIQLTLKNSWNSVKPGCVAMVS